MLGGETPSREPVLLGAYSHEEAEAEVCGVFHDPALDRAATGRIPAKFGCLAIPGGNSPHPAPNANNGPFRGDPRRWEPHRRVLEPPPGLRGRKRSAGPPPDDPVVNVILRHADAAERLETWVRARRPDSR